MAADESTHLLGQSTEAQKSWKSWKFFSKADRVLVAGFLVSVALSFTQVPILYVFRLMECEAFYQHHPASKNGTTADRCSRNEVDAATAMQVSILGASTMFCSVLNLFYAGWQIKTWGPKTALVVQTAFPALRVAVQVVGVAIGARAGVVIVQLSQLISLVGGQAGYILVLNTAAGEVVAPARRTAVFGMLQGAIMLGTALGYLLGGMTGDAFGIRRPFEVATVLFALSSIFAAVFIPYIDPETLGGDGSTPVRPKGARAFLGGLHVLAPKRMRLENGRLIRHYGVTFLALGVFTGVLATGYAPILIQMYSTAAFDFLPSENGYLMATNSLIRGIFLIFVFPRVIDAGRRWFAPRATTSGPASSTGANDGPIATTPEDLDPVAGILPAQEPAKPIAPADENAGRAFDLFFLRWSLVADGLVTAYTASATTGWHIYLAGFLLPLASGSAPASKGVITEMCAGPERADALQAMTLVENVAMLSTLGLFGFIFSAFSQIGKAYLTFYCNAVVALLAVAILLLSHFPPPDSTVEEEESLLDDDEA